VKLSVCLLVKNEEEKMVRLLNNVKNIGDELILIDSGSTDLTKQIAKIVVPEIKMHSIIFDNDFSKLKNEGYSKSSGDWVLFVDADEIILEKYHSTIINIIENSDSDIIAFARRQWKDLGMNEEDRAPYPDWQLRLIRKKEGLYFKNRIHTTAVGYNKIIRTENVIIEHFNLAYMSEKDWEIKNKNYRELERLVKEGK